MEKKVVEKEISEGKHSKDMKNDKENSYIKELNTKHDKKKSSISTIAKELTK